MTRRAALALLLLTGCARSHGDVDAAPVAFTVEADAVRLSDDVAHAIRFPTAPAQRGRPLPGPPVTARITTVPELTAPSFAPLAGRVAQVRARLGEHVAAGDRLMLVQTTELPELRHALASARLEVRTKTAIADRMKRLVESRVGAEHDMIVARSELAEAELAVKTAAARLNSLAIESDGDGAYWVLANRAGTVVQLDATQGMQVGPERDTPVATIADLRQVLIVGDAAQRDASTLRPGAEAEIRIPGAQRPASRGVLVGIADVVDPERQTVPLRVLADNDGGLRPNAFVELSFAPPDTEAVLVPAAAVVSDGATSVVFVEEAPGLLRRREVEVGRRSKAVVEIHSGLDADERVVTSGALLLSNAIETELAR